MCNREYSAVPVARQPALDRLLLSIAIPTCSTYATLRDDASAHRPFLCTTAVLDEPNLPRTIVPGWYVHKRSASSTGLRIDILLPAWLHNHHLLQLLALVELPVDLVVNLAQHILDFVPGRQSGHVDTWVQILQSELGLELHFELVQRLRILATADPDQSWGCIPNVGRHFGAAAFVVVEAHDRWFPEESRP